MNDLAVRWSIRKYKAYNIISIVVKPIPNSDQSRTQQLGSDQLKWVLAQFETKREISTVKPFYFVEVCFQLMASNELKLRSTAAKARMYLIHCLRVQGVISEWSLPKR